MRNKIFAGLAIVIAIGVGAALAIPQSRMYVGAYVGDTVSQYSLGKSLIQKHDKVSVRKGLVWLETAALKGNTDAQYLLGSTYAYGEIVERNFSLAAKWLKMAADGHNVRACASLATLYKMGLGVEKNENEAQRLLKYCRARGEHGSTE
jgi:TPR repeat protein